MDHIETYSLDAKCWCGEKVIGIPGRGGGVYACPFREDSSISPCPRCAELEQENATLRGAVEWACNPIRPGRPEDTWWPWNDREDQNEFVAELRRRAGVK